MRYVAEIALALACGLAFYFFANYDAARLYGLANTLATVGGVLFGFLLTAIAMMVSLPERRLVANMRLTGHYSVLMKGTLRACGFHFAALIVSLVAVFSTGWFLELACRWPSPWKRSPSCGLARLGGVSGWCSKCWSTATR